MALEPADITEPTHDLDRVLAEAMSEGAVLAEQTATEERDDDGGESSVLKWSLPGAGRSPRHAVIAIDYSPGHVTLVELQRTGQPTIQALQTVNFENPPDAATLTQLLREFASDGPWRVELALTSPRSVVRQFKLPPVPKNRRWQAAIWEAQKLIPFALTESEAVFGFAFAPLGQSGWRVTLSAIPREDGGPILDALAEVRWLIQGVSIAGTSALPETERSKTDQPAVTVATVLWSAMRTSFVVFHNRKLKFHYDLGPLPAPEVPPDGEPSPGMLREWIDSLEKGVAEAFEFYVGAHPVFTIDRVELLGLPEPVAPLLSDWQERLDVPVLLVNPISDYIRDLPEDIGNWLVSNSTTITTAVMAAVGTPTVDMTPPALVKTRLSKRGERIARGLLAGSVIVAAVWTGLLWMQKTIASQNVLETHAQLQELRSSPVNGTLERSVSEMRQVSLMVAAATAPSKRWMPYLKSIVATFPEQTRLMAMSAGVPVGETPETSQLPSVRLDGKLLPQSRSHALTYADWFSNLETIVGVGRVNLVSDRTVEWKGRRTSVFSMEIGAGPETAKERR
jgi:hypothetical protein